MPIAFVAADSNAVTVAATTDTLSAFNVGSSDNRLIILAVYTRFVGEVEALAATYNTTENFVIHQHRDSVDDAAASQGLNILTLVPTSTGTNDIVVTYTGTNNTLWAIAAVSYSGVDAIAAGVWTADGSTVSDPALQITSATDRVGISVISKRNSGASTVTGDATQVLRAGLATTTGNGWCGFSTLDPSQVTLDMGWTGNIDDDRWAYLTDLTPTAAPTVVTPTGVSATAGIGVPTVLKIIDVVLTDAAANDALNGVVDMVDVNAPGEIQITSSAGVYTSPLATLPLQNPGFDSPASPGLTATLQGTPQDPSAAGTGTPVEMRWRDGNGLVVMTNDTTGGDASVEGDTIDALDEINATSYTLTFVVK